MHPLATLFVASLLGVCSTAAAPDLHTRQNSVVDLEYARYQANRNVLTDVTSFLGIRYAAAPVGDLRFRAPQPPPTASGVQRASENPKQCYQGWLLGGLAWDSGSSVKELTRSPEERALAGTSEDCLCLNVHIPGRVDPDKKLPVIVWIHGGGYVSGSASAYDGAKLVTGANKQVISVVIQYRLGLFGFLAGEEVKKGGALNAGLLDQEFALKWVQEHISKFGGDPAKVTIWGQSAGAGSVLQHIVAHDGQTSPPLFNKAITSSLYFPPQYPYDDEIPQGVYDRVVQKAGCAAQPDTLACLRATDISRLDSVNQIINKEGFYGTYTFVPVVDGEFVRQDVGRSLREKKVNGDALLSITNADEGFLFVNPLNPISPTKYAKNLFPKLSDEQADGIGRAYEGMGSKFDQASKMLAESTFLCPTIRLPEAFETQAYQGTFAIAPAVHMQDLLYYFKGYTPPIARIPPILPLGSFADAFAGSFFEFALSGRPSDSWPGFTPNDSKSEMYFGQKGVLGMSTDIRMREVDRGLLERCRLWAGLREGS